jgi:oxygen-independent coproporphyrinogen III oxidase
VSELSLYIHIPFCRSKCGYCSFTSYSGRDLEKPAYIEALSKEIVLAKRLDVTVKTIYFGGGTPSTLDLSEVDAILESIYQNYQVDPGAEITFEANPGIIELDYLHSLKGLCINRLSLGVQSLDDRELAFLGRYHSTIQALQAIDDARSAGFTNLSLDFIYGLHGRTISNWESMLNQIIDLGAEHLSLYGLTLEPDTPLGMAVAKGEHPSPDPDQAATEYESAATKLAAAGYRHYEISNWARPGFESRHNTVYWKRGEYLGLGVAAHSFVDGRRIANTSDLDEYLTRLTACELPQTEMEIVTDEMALLEAIFLGLRLEQGISLDDIGRQFSIDLRSKFSKEIAELSGLGLIELSADRLRLTLRGCLLGNEVFLRFLPS